MRYTFGVPKMTAERPLLLTAERIVDACSRMTDAERDALHAWEAEHVKGDGRFATSDWPGWSAIFIRLSH